jgi:hypothetical protein
MPRPTILLASALTSTAAAQTFVNGDFQTHDFTGWTVANTTNGAGAPGQVLTTDIDDAGPLPLSLAAAFSVGQAVPFPNAQEGVEMTQNLTLQAGHRYTVALDWKVISINGAYADAGFFSIIVNGAVAATQSATFVSQSTDAHSHLVGSFTPATSGPHAVGVRITRDFLPGQFLTQFVDNVTITTACYANCDGSTTAPILTVNDFVCFQTAFAAGDSYANCDNSTTPPILTVNDFVCFQTAFAAGCN